MKIHSQFTFDSVAFDKDNDVHLVIGLTAPAIQGQEKRPRICVIPCIDISGSMQGAKLEYAKKAALKLVDQLSPGDFGGLVTFSDQGRVDFPPCEMTQVRKDELKSVIGKIHIEGGTNFSDGMLKALEAAKRLDLGGSTITRVIMLTDGQPTHGIAKDSKSLNLLLDKSRGHATLSAFGFGYDPDQALLSSLAETGHGNYAFVQDPDNALASFGKELGGLLSTYAQSVVVEVTPTNGHTVSEVLSDVETEEEVDGEVSIKVPAILAEETNNLVLSVKLAAQKHAGPRQVNAFHVKATFQRLGEDGSVLNETFESKAKIQFVKSGDEQKIPTKALDEIVARTQLVKAQVEAEKAAQRGDFQAANQAFQVAAASFQTRGHEGLVGATNHINGLYATNASYSLNSGRRTALRNATSRGTSSVLRGEDAQVLLSSNYSLSTPSQELMTQSFVSSDLQTPSVPNPSVNSANGLPSSTIANGMDWFSAQALPSSAAPTELASTPTVPELKKHKVSKSKSKRW